LATNHLFLFYLENDQLSPPTAMLEKCNHLQGLPSHSGSFLLPHTQVERAW